MSLARILIGRDREKRLIHQRHDQSGSTPKKSTANRILALLRILTERLRDFRIGLLAAYVNLREMFSSVDRDALWRILALREIHQKLSVLACILVQECCEVWWHHLGLLPSKYSGKSVMRVLASILFINCKNHVGQNFGKLWLKSVVWSIPDHES